MADNVNHPAHYNMGGIEVIDAIEAWGFGEGFNRGNATSTSQEPAGKTQTKPSKIWRRQGSISTVRFSA